MSTNGKTQFAGERWWEKGGGTVVYQIYPQSFKDSNGDGIGDLPGIISKLDYIKSLGVEAIWLCPHFKSPRVDEGYDISDYQDIYEPYGTVQDCDELIQKAHALGLKVMFDLVVNHCSDKHPWFIESRSSKESPKRDWFHWRPAKYVDGKRCPPNNWRATFGGSAWQWDEGSQEYYLHLFEKEQPDMRWETEKLRKALYENAVLFWLERGLDGFRIDTVGLYAKLTDFPDAPVEDPESEFQPPRSLVRGRPRIHEYLREMYETTWAFYDTFTIGELSAPTEHQALLPYLARDRRELDCAIQFAIADIDRLKHSRHPLSTIPWRVSDFKRYTAFYQSLCEPQYNAHCISYLENHDIARCVTRYASDAPEHRVASAKMMCTYLTTQSGSLIIYEGQEIGMINIPRDWDIEKEYKDVYTLNCMKNLKAEAAKTGDKDLVKTGSDGIRITARDHARTPMQWDSSTAAGFSTSSKTWMRVMDSYKDINVAAQEGDPESPLHFYRHLLRLRKVHADSFVRGKFELQDPENESTMLYTKTSDKSKLTVQLNFTDKPQSVPAGEGKMLFSTLGGAQDTLGPYEARLYMSL